MISKDLKIVVVDDEPIIRMNLSDMLNTAGYRVVGRGCDGKEAIELCREHRPDVAILDIEMPRMDGLEAAKIIRREYPETAIVMLTAYSKGEYIDKAKDSKINSYILKPINERLLVPNIELAVEKNKELREYREKITRVEDSLEERKLIEKAKGLLMKAKQLSEEEAFRRIREVSKKRKLSMVRVAEIIIKGFEGR